MVHVQVSQVSASTGAVAGFGAMTVGAVTDRLGLAVAGCAVFIVSTMIVCLLVLLRALRDTAVERAALIEEREAAVAAQAGIASERERLRADLIRSRRVVTEMLTRERQAMLLDLEQRTHVIRSEAVEATARMFFSGVFDEVPAPASGVLVRLPVRQSMDDVILAASDE